MRLFTLKLYTWGQTLHMHSKIRIFFLGDLYKSGSILPVAIIIVDSLICTDANYSCVHCQAPFVGKKIILIFT